MAIHYLKWNGTDCRTKNITVQNRMPVIRPEERVEHVTIPGRSGDLTLTEGEAVYNSYIQTAQISVIGAENVPEAKAWLRGAGKVTFDSQDDMEQDARIIGALTFEKHSRNVDKWHADVQFYCEPVKRKINESVINITSSGTSINNPGDMTASPLIKITGSGTVTIKCGDKTLAIPECTSGWIIDSENEWILDSNSVPQMNVCSGEFPILKQGANTITYTGSITKLEITPRFRYL